MHQLFRQNRQKFIWEFKPDLSGRVNFKLPFFATGNGPKFCPKKGKYSVYYKKTSHELRNRVNST